jgi:hypothetical protein
MYVFGNGEILAQKSDRWKQVVQEFKDQDGYGTALPIACYRHLDVQWVEDGTHLRKISPDGMCDDDQVLII